MADAKVFTSLQRWSYVPGPTAAQALRNLADFIDRALADDAGEAVNGLDGDIIPVLLCRDAEAEEGDPDCYRAGLCVSWTSERTSE